MSSTTVELNLPPDILQHAQDVADQSGRTLESVLLESLTILFSPPDALFSSQQIEHLSDAQLWLLSHRPLTLADDARLQSLIAQGQQSALSDAQQADLERLVTQADHLMLLRSKALLTLQQRGHDLTAHLTL
jgi:hypothetical protein